MSNSCSLLFFRPGNMEPMKYKLDTCLWNINSVRYISSLWMLYSVVKLSQGCHRKINLLMYFHAFFRIALKCRYILIWILKINTKLRRHAQQYEWHAYEHTNPVSLLVYTHQIALVTETLTEVLKTTLSEYILGNKAEHQKRTRTESIKNIISFKLQFFMKEASSFTCFGKILMSANAATNNGVGKN